MRLYRLHKFVGVNSQLPDVHAVLRQVAKTHTSKTIALQQQSDISAILM